MLETLKEILKAPKTADQAVALISSLPILLFAVLILKMFGLDPDQERRPPKSKTAIKAAHSDKKP